MIVPLYEHQKEAVEKIKNGSILCGGVGTGKSRTALAYFWKYIACRGQRNVDLYVITTAKKRDSKDWEGEASYFLIGDEVNTYSKTRLIVESWNNLGKFIDVEGAFFIFDEQRVVGNGTWVKNFLKIAKKNRWILLTATPGDTWMDYIPVFLANGFYKNRSDFIRQHVIFSRFSKYPKVERYWNEEKLEKLRKMVLVEMKFERRTVSQPEILECGYNKHDFMRIYRGRWDIFEEKPIRQAGEWCYLLRKVVNLGADRVKWAVKIAEKCQKLVIFYNFNYELDLLKESFQTYFLDKMSIFEYNGHRHDPVPKGENWVYLVQYNAGSEAWNCTETDSILFYSLNYSYKIMEQAAGRINRMNTEFNVLHYYILVSESPIDKAIRVALKNKRNFNESRYWTREAKNSKVMGQKSQNVLKDEKL